MTEQESIMAFLESLIESHNKEVEETEYEIAVASKRVEEMRQESEENEKTIQSLKEKAAAAKHVDPRELAMQVAMQQTMVVPIDFSETFNATTLDESVVKQEVEYKSFCEEFVFLEETAIEVDEQEKPVDHNQLEQKIQEFHRSINWSDKAIKLAIAYDLKGSNEDETKVFSIECPKCEQKFMVSRKITHRGEEVKTEIYENHVLMSHVF